MDHRKELTERFIRYVGISSQSDASAGVVPSTDGQRRYAMLLAQELKDLGLCDVSVDEHAAVYATLKANVDGVPCIGFCSHLDTVDVSLSPDVHPQIISYQGGDVVLNKELGIVLKASEHPELAEYVGEDIIFTDGTSVLGADNKAAAANIMTMLAILKEDPSIPHGEIKISFVADEEIGLCGSKLLDLSKFDPDFAYTIDCCHEGDVVYETFNAGSAVVKIRGVSAHPMSAKGVLINPLLVAYDLISMFDRNQTPECTEGKEGYWWFNGISADATFCTLNVNIRDHDKSSYEMRKRVLRENVEKLKKAYPRADIELSISDTYENISNGVNVTDTPVALIYEALDKLGIKAHTYAMRGGTDGSALSPRGIVTPNYFTGALNFHSNAEFLPLCAFEKSLQVTLKLVELVSKFTK